MTNTTPTTELIKTNGGAMYVVTNAYDVKETLKSRGYEYDYSGGWMIETKDKDAALDEMTWLHSQGWGWADDATADLAARVAASRS